MSYTDLLRNLDTFNDNFDDDPDPSCPHCGSEDVTEDVENVGNDGEVTHGTCAKCGPIPWMGTDEWRDICTDAALAEWRRGVAMEQETELVPS